MKTLEERWHDANAAGDTVTAELLAELIDARGANTSEDSDDLIFAIDQLKSLKSQLYSLISSIEATLGGLE